MSWKSFAQWPVGTLSINDDISNDTHATRAQAEGVTRMLRQEGLGGEGRIFPVRVWVEGPPEETRREFTRPSDGARITTQKVGKVYVGTIHPKGQDPSPVVVVPPGARLNPKWFDLLEPADGTAHEKWKADAEKYFNTECDCGLCRPS